MTASRLNALLDMTLLLCSEVVSDIGTAAADIGSLVLPEPSWQWCGWRTLLHTVATPLSFGCSPLRQVLVALEVARNRASGRGVPRRRGSGDEKGAVHDPGVRVAEEAVAALLDRQHEALRSGVFHTGENAVEAGSAQVEVVNVGAVTDHEAVSRSGLEFCDFLALQ